MYNPLGVWEACSATTMALAGVARSRLLVLCVGAGVSKPDPTDLPLGGEVADLVAPALRERGFAEAIAACAERELLCIADAMNLIDGGRDLLQQLLRDCAGWTTADSNFAHEAIAVLIGEGLAEVLTTNWDDCVERARRDPPRLQAVVSEGDLASVAGPSILKVHGCATRIGTLLGSRPR